MRVYNRVYVECFLFLNYNHLSKVTDKYGSVFDCLIHKKQLGIVYDKTSFIA